MRTRQKGEGSAERQVVAEPQRLDRLLASLPRIGSRNRARQVLESGKITVDGAPVGLADAGRTLEAGAVVVVDWDRPGTALDAVRGRRKVADAGVVVLYDDPDVIALDKPVGLLTDTASAQQAKERDSLRKRLVPWLRAQGARPLIVHRIDRDTSGVVLVAKHEQAAEALRQQFRARAPERVYLVVVEGVLRPEEGTWEDPMAWDSGRRIQRRCKPDDPGAFLARAHYRVREILGGASLLEVRLETGRRNQIRLQAQLRGHPLVGERLYREGPPTLTFPRQALHAHRLTVRHPRTGKPLTIASPLPPDLQRLLARLRKGAVS